MIRVYLRLVTNVADETDVAVGLHVVAQSVLGGKPAENRIKMTLINHI